MYYYTISVIGDIAWHWNGDIQSFDEVVEGTNWVCIRNVSGELDLDAVLLEKN